MADVVQQAVQAAAYSSALTRALAVFCAVGVLVLLALGWLALLWQRRASISVATAARIAALLVLSYVIAKVLGHFVLDPRPYLLEGIAPLTAVAHDNGFPSDHTLLAAALTASVVWIAPRYVGYFILGTLLVLLGRLGIAAHHTLDVAGSVFIVVVVALAVSAARLPAAWRQPVLPLTRWQLGR